MTPTEVRQLSDEQIKGEIHAARDRLFKLRAQAVTEKVENTGLFRTTRKDLARLLTERTVRRAKQHPPARTSGSPASAAKPAPKTQTKKPVAGVTGKPVRTKPSAKKTGSKKTAKAS